MATVSKTCDVFVSHTLRDVELAREIGTAFRAVELEPSLSAEFSIEAGDGDALRQAILESRAFLSVVSSAGLTSWMAFELGAAQMWDKPLFALMTNLSANPPAALKKALLFGVGSIDELVRAVKLGGEAITLDERESLVRVYGEMSLPFRDFLLDSSHIDELAGRFKAHTHRSVSGERLYSELLRLHKQGLLRRYPQRKTG